MTKQNKWQEELGRIKNSKRALSFFTLKKKKKGEMCEAKSPSVSALLQRSPGLLVPQEDDEGSAQTSPAAGHG